MRPSRGKYYIDAAGNRAFKKKAANHMLDYIISEAEVVGELEANCIEISADGSDGSRNRNGTCCRFWGNLGKLRGRPLRLDFPPSPRARHLLPMPRHSRLDAPGASPM
jgi:hypothetical protein